MLAILLVLAIGAQATLVPRACTYSATAQVGSTCDSIASDWGITVNQFKTWNPTVKDCSKLTSGASYCVEWSGALPGQTSAPTATKTSTTTTKTPTPAKTTTTKAKTATSAPSGPSPTQEGIIKTCNKWHLVVKDEFCQTVVDKEKISLENFYKWNSAVGTDCKGLWLGYYVCVGVSGGTTTTKKPTATTKKPTTTTKKPTTTAKKPTTTTKKETSTTTKSAPPAVKTQPGVVSKCKKFHKVASGEGCWAVENKYKITHANFAKWNPMLDDTCSNMWLGYSVCIGV